MRLLHTKKLTLEEFVGDEIPHYAILSHTWEKEEVTLRDMKMGQAKKSKGYTKVKTACLIAAAGGFEYIWIDTCCIDKTSSAELSEALNSMYRWYEEAEECYAYLADTLAENDGFRESRWFTRGWTLQELIAPSTVVFLNTNWQKIGSKFSLHESISKITRIPSSFLLGDDLEYASVAQRMSWASKRKTKRAEDQAYCLMGIFGIFMPMLYGEGDRAFIRLQEEIMRTSDDDSLFAWKSPEEDHAGILASSPSAFADCHNIIKMKPLNSVNSHPVISSRGIRLSLYFGCNNSKNPYHAVLNCTELGKEGMRLAVLLRDVPPTTQDFERERGSGPKLLRLKEIVPPNYTLKEFYVKQQRSTRNSKLEDVEKCVIVLGGVKWEDIASSTSHLHSGWELHDGMMITTMALPSSGTLGRLLIICEDGNSFQILLNKYGKCITADIYANFDKSPQIDRRPNILKERDLIYKSGPDGMYVNVAIKRRVLMLHKKNILVGMIEISYFNALPMMWVRHVSLLQDDMNPTTLLLYLVHEGNETILQLLLNTKKIDINLKDENELTPLSWAIQDKNKSAVKLLLENGAKLEAKTKYGWTPLFLAVDSRD